jgi:hypothetical protein
VWSNPASDKCQRTGVVLGQVCVGAKTNEIPMLAGLLKVLDVNGAVITADAMHCQRDTAQTIRDGGDHSILTVKGNRPNLRKRVKSLPWKDIPPLAISRMPIGVLGQQSGGVRTIVPDQAAARPSALGHHSPQPGRVVVVNLLPPQRQFLGYPESARLIRSPNCCAVVGRIVRKNTGLTIYDTVSKE